MNRLNKELIIWSITFRQTKKLDLKKWPIWLMTFNTSNRSVQNKTINTKERSAWKVLKWSTTSKQTSLILTKSRKKWLLFKNQKNLNHEFSFRINDLILSILNILININKICNSYKCTWIKIAIFLIGLLHLQKAVSEKQYRILCTSFLFLMVYLLIKLTFLTRLQV